MYCHNCGNELPDEAHFCDKCGTPVQAVSTTQREVVTEKEATDDVPRRKTRAWWVAPVAALVVALAVLGVSLFVRRPVPPSGLALDESAFPDEALRAQIAQAADLDGDGMLSDEELASLRTLRVTGVRDVSGLEVFPALEELVVEGDQLEELHIHDMASLEKLTGAHVPNLREVSVTNAPKLKEAVIQDAPQLSAASFEETGSLEIVDVPEQTELTGDVDKVLVNCYVLKSFVETYESSFGSSSESITAGYDEQGHLTALAREHTTTAAIPDLYTPSFTAELSYSEDGLLQRVEVDDTGYYAGTWEVSYANNQRDVSYAFEPAASNGSQSGDYRNDVFSENGRLLQRTFAFRNDGGYPKGDMSVDYDENGQPVRFEGMFNQTQGRDGHWETTVEYDSKGRITSSTETLSESGYGSTSYYTYDSKGNLESIADRDLTTYAYDDKGHLTHASSRTSEADFVTDEDGRITSATIRYDGGSVATYTVEYEVLRLLPGQTPMEAVDFTDPLNPTYTNMPWCDGWWSAKDLLRLNRAWLAQSSAEEGATSSEKPEETADPFANGALPAAYQQVIDGGGHPHPDTAHYSGTMHFSVLEDLDNNGTPELILAYDTEEMGYVNTSICAIWTLDEDGSAVCLLDHPYRGGMSILQDGTVLEASTSSAFDWHSWYWRIDGTSVTKVVSFDHDGSSDNQVVDTYYTNLDEGINNQVVDDAFRESFAASHPIREDLAWQAVSE